MCATGTLLLVDTKFRCGARAPSPAAEAAPFFLVPFFFFFLFLFSFLFFLLLFSGDGARVPGSWNGSSLPAAFQSPDSGEPRFRGLRSQRGSQWHSEQLGERGDAFGACRFRGMFFWSPFWFSLHKRMGFPISFLVSLKHHEKGGLCTWDDGILFRRGADCSDLCLTTLIIGVMNKLLGETRQITHGRAYGSPKNRGSIRWMYQLIVFACLDPSRSLLGEAWCLGRQSLAPMQLA